RRWALTPADHLLHLSPDPVEADAQLLESSGGNPFTFGDETEEDVLRADHVVAQPPRLLLREHDHLLRPFGEPSKHPGSTFLRTLSLDILTLNLEPFPDQGRPLEIPFRRRQLPAHQALQVRRTNADHKLLQDGLRDAADQAQINPQPHIGQEAEGLLGRKGPGVGDDAEGAVDGILQLDALAVKKRLPSLPLL